jgi:hypothetical protein
LRRRLVRWSERWSIACCDDDEGAGVVITNALIALASGIVSVFNSLLPHFTAPSWFGASSGLSSVATYMGDVLSIFQPILPVDAIINVMAALFIILPVVGAYTVFQWIWNHVPSIAGFGTH